MVTELMRVTVQGILYKQMIQNMRSLCSAPGNVSWCWEV